MYVVAVQETNLPESYINSNSEVGRFDVPSQLPPYQWVKVPFVKTSTRLERKLEYAWAWVIHNGKGEVYGESCGEDDAIPSEPVGEEDFRPPNASDNYTFVQSSQSEIVEGECIFSFDNMPGGLIPGTDELFAMSTSIIWFSRHSMTESQLAALSSKLGKITVTQVDGTMPNVHVSFPGKLNGEDAEIPAFKELVKDFDVVAIVAPINLQQQILSVSGEKPVIIAQSNRVRKELPEGQPAEFEFIFAGWHQLKKIEVITEEFAS